MKERRLPLHVRILQHELDQRKAKNQRYSMRAFARDLEIDPSALSRILAAKQDVSLETCRLILKKVELPRAQARLFIAAVSEYKRNQSYAALTRALEPRYMEETEIDPRLETIRMPGDPKVIDSYDVLTLDADFNSIMDLEGRFLHVNETTARMLDMIPCELIGERWPSTTFDVQTPELLEKQQAEVVESQKPKTFEFTVGRHESIRHLRRTITPLFDADGRMNAYASSIRDVTADRFLLSAVQRVHSSIDPKTVVASAVEAATPVLADACLLRLEKPTYHLAGSLYGEPNEAYSEFVRSLDSEMSLPNDRRLIEELPVAISQKLAFSNFAPTHAMSLPLETTDHVVGSMVFLAKRPFVDFDLQIAQRYVQSVSSALQNAFECARPATETVRFPDRFL